MNIDLVCPSTLRPMLLRKTLYSFKTKLFQSKLKTFRLIINVDYTGEQDFNIAESKFLDICRIIDRIKFRQVVMRISYQPNFAEAWFWAMQQTRADLTFYLEEDWELIAEVDFDKMLRLFANQKDLAHLRLSNFNSDFFQCKNWNKFLEWNGEFFEAISEDKYSVGWAGHPSLNRTEFIKKCLAIIDPRLNPEKQIKGRRIANHPMNQLLSSYRFGSFIAQDQPKQIVDLGRNWMIENGWRKAGNKAFFTKWEKA